MKHKEPSMNSIERRLREVIVDRLRVEDHLVTTEARFVEDLGATSLDVIELVMTFEEEFGYAIPDEAAEMMNTFGDALAFLEKADDNKAGR
jgi:acyl carrier protein